MHLIPSFGPVSKRLVPVFDHFEIIIFKNKFRSSFLLFGQKFPKNYLSNWCGLTIFSNQCIVTLTFDILTQNI